MSRAIGKKLPRSFYNHPTLEVSQKILGMVLVYDSPQGRRAGRIVEVEAYIGEGDPACHAACGPTNRNRLMYGKPGVAYIYLIYGMYYCLNVVTESVRHPAAILIRAAEPLEGNEPTGKHGFRGHPYHLMSGPGKLCRAFGLTLAQNGVDLTRGSLYLENRNLAPTRIETSQRIGIRKGRELQWRFFDADSKSVSELKNRVVEHV